MVVRTMGAGGLAAIMRAARSRWAPHPAEDLSWLLHGPTDPEIVDAPVLARDWPLAAE